MNTLEMSYFEPVGVNSCGTQAWGLIPDLREMTEDIGPEKKIAVTCEEFELIKSLRKGDEPAFATLVERYHGGLLRFAQALVSNQAVAKEVVQETWMAVLEGIHRFEGRSSLKTWIFRILQNIAKTKGKREHRYVSFCDVDGSTDKEKNSALASERFYTSGDLTGRRAFPSIIWDENTPERLLVSKQSLVQINQALQALPPNQRQVIILRDIEGVNAEEICQILNITLTNQRVLLHRARAKIRLALNPYLQGHSPKSPAPSVWVSLVPNEKPGISL
ncbi:RNA polymerase sigma factor [Nitrospira sp. Ecomares 2.1]